MCVCVCVCVMNGIDTQKFVEKPFYIYKFVNLDQFQTSAMIKGYSFNDCLHLKTERLMNVKELASLELSNLTSEILNFVHVYI